MLFFKSQGLGSHLLGSTDQNFSVLFVALCPEILVARGKTWEESDTRTPLICFLSMGSDPTIQIDALAKKLKLGMNSNL